MKYQNHLKGGGDSHFLSGHELKVYYSKLPRRPSFPESTFEKTVFLPFLTVDANFLTSFCYFGLDYS